MNVPPEQIELAKRNIAQFADLKRYLDEDWLKSKLNVEGKVHPMFWILADSVSCSRLSLNLKNLERSCHKFSRIITKLKKDEDNENFLSLLSEIEVLAYYIRLGKFDEVEYEPRIEESNHKADILLSVDGEKYYLEIFTMFLGDKQKEFFNMCSEIKEQVEKISKFAVNITIILRGSECLGSTSFSEIKDDLEKGTIPNKMRDIINSSGKYTVSLKASLKKMNGSKWKVIDHQEEFLVEKEKVDDGGPDKEKIFVYDKHFSNNDIPELIDIIKKRFSEGIAKEEYEFPFIKNNREIATVNFHKPAGVGKTQCNVLVPSHADKKGGRTKNKILSKSDQVGKNAKNVIIINFSPSTNRWDDIEEAVFGQYCHIAHESNLSSRPNGIVQDNRGRLFSMIIAYTNYDYNTRKKLINPYAQKVIAQSEIEKF